MEAQQTLLSPLSRRAMLHASSLAMAGLCLPKRVLAIEENTSVRYFVATVQTATQPATEKTFPFDWPVAGVTSEPTSVALHWPILPRLRNRELRFRITSATDLRQACTLELRLIKSGEKVAELNVQYAHYMQPFECVLNADAAKKVAEEGVHISTKGSDQPFYFFVSKSGGDGPPTSYLPHLLVTEKRVDTSEWKNRLLSPASLSTFGWMEGCVLDGINSMAGSHRRAAAAFDEHLNAYFSNNGLVYEGYNNVRVRGEANNVESILPFAMLATRQPGHPMINTAIDFCKRHADAKGVIADDFGNNRKLKTEECYTIAYPLAMLGKLQSKPELYEMAIANLERRVSLLVRDGVIYQNSREQESPEFGNWARGVGWYLLGLAKTSAQLPSTYNTAPLKKALQEGFGIVHSHQQKNGLWHCFLHQHETGIDTSGSAAIAAALAFGYADGLLPYQAYAAAKLSQTSLQSDFTPDGYLTGTAQVNKGGLALQTGGFRVISPYTLGFLAMLEQGLQKGRMRPGHRLR